MKNNMHSKKNNIFILYKIINIIEYIEYDTN